MDAARILSRWSRRKRAASIAKEATNVPRQITPSARCAFAEEPGGSASHDTRNAEGGAAGHAAPGPDLPDLVPIEDITAETDIKGFLAPGIPAELARAALRRAWHSDPVIRDFVGPAEYAWDFNAPDSMAGFGILDASSQIDRQLARLIGKGATEIIGAEPPVLQPAIDEHPATRTVPNSVEQCDPAQPAQQHDQIAVSHEPSGERADPSALRRRKHGRALPS